MVFEIVRDFVSVFVMLKRTICSHVTSLSIYFAHHDKIYAFV